MSPQLVGILCIVILLILMFARMNIGLSMAAVGFIGLVCISGIESALGALASTPFTTVATYTLSAIPLFIFMGAIVSNTGIGTDLYTAAYKWLGQFKGGLAIATVAACAFFAAICGSSQAETLTMGKLALPEMKKYNYDPSLAAGTVAAGGTLGILIPPSIGFLVYAILTQESAGILFMAGILPGILLSTLFIIVIVARCQINPLAGPAGTKTTFIEKLTSLKRVWTILALFILVLGGIYLGIFTPTEAGAIGAFGAIVITLISRQLSIKNLLNSVLDAGLSAAMIMILIIGAFIFMKLLTVSNLALIMADFITGLGLSPYLIWVVIVVLYLLLGMFLDIMSAMALTIPIFYPVIIRLGFDPIWFGVQVVLLMELGLITPPIGMNVFILSSITDIPMGTIFRGVWLFVVAMLVSITLVTIWPQIALFIPSLM